MKTIYLTIVCLIMPFAAFGQNNTKVYKADGLYFTNEEQTELYDGDFKEYYEEGTLKMEIFIKKGRPEGTYVVYFPNERIQEIRSYKEGELHGTWRTYSELGVMLSHAEYVEGRKAGTWFIWNENGVKLYEMYYSEGKRVGN